MGSRILKINSEIQKFLGGIIRNMNNPILKDEIISVTDCRTTEDLEICKVYLSVFNKDKQEDILNQIKHSAAYIRKNLAAQLNIRKVPYLEFYLDNSIEYGARIDAVLDKIGELKKDNLDED